MTPMESETANMTRLVDKLRTLLPKPYSYWNEVLEEAMRSANAAALPNVYRDFGVWLLRSHVAPYAQQAAGMVEAAAVCVEADWTGIDREAFAAEALMVVGEINELMYITDRPDAKTAKLYRYARDAALVASYIASDAIEDAVGYASRDPDSPVVMVEKLLDLLYSYRKHHIHDHVADRAS